MGPEDLKTALAGLSYFRSPEVLVGTETMDDAGVYRIAPDLALIQTVDFFTPIVDDPGAFGEIAVANSLSDVYAMGGRPITALNILCYPMNDLDHATLHEILEGGARKLAEAETSCLGGHSVTDKELKYGCAVTGTVHPDRIWRNVGARPGDALILTKPLGTGIVATAGKKGLLKPGEGEALDFSLKLLNKIAAEVGREHKIHAATDITGYGLYGHGGGIAHASGVTMEIEVASLPLLPGALAHAAAGCVTRGDKSNRKMYGGRYQVESASITAAHQSIVFDPQTSGGLLFCLPAEEADDLLAAMLARGVSAARIGKVTFSVKATAGELVMRLV